MQTICSFLSRLNVWLCLIQASPTWLSSRTCLCEPSRAAVSTTPLLRSHQKRRSSVKSMVKPLGDTRLVLATMTRLFPSNEALSTTGWAPISVQNNFLKIKRSIVRKKPPTDCMKRKWLRLGNMNYFRTNEYTRHDIIFCTNLLLIMAQTLTFLMDELQFLEVFLVPCLQQFVCSIQPRCCRKQLPGWRTKINYRYIDSCNNCLQVNVFFPGFNSG